LASVALTTKISGLNVLAMYCLKWIPKADNLVDSHAQCQPQQYAWVDWSVTSFMVGGQETAARNLAVNGLHVDGAWNVPSRTCPNALVKPHSPKMSVKQCQISLLTYFDNCL